MTDEQTQIAIAIPDAARFDEVLAAAQAAGFRPSSLFRRLGAATGTAPRASIERLRALDGIGTVEEERSFRAL